MPDYSSVAAVFPLAVYPIVGVDTGTEEFVVDGDQTARFLVDDVFTVIDSTGNDGEYTVASRTYASGPDETTIVVNENITDATVDGKILHDEIADTLPITESHDDVDDRDAAAPDQYAGAHARRISNEIRALGRTVGIALGLEVIDAGGLDIYHSGGSLIFGSGTPIDIAPNKLTVADDDDSYIEVNSSGTVSSNTTGFSNGQYPLAIVTTVAGDITRIQDKRGALYLAEFTEANLDDLAASLFDPTTELTISGGVVTRTQNVHRIDTESDASSDDLDTINGFADGMLIIIRAENSARTVVLKDGTGNLALNGADITLDDTDPFIFLQYDGVLSKWVIIGGVGATVPDASTTVKGITKLATAPVSPTSPIAVGDNDPRNTDARTPVAHDLAGAEHNADTLADLNSKVSDGTLIDTADSRLSDSRIPTGAAGGDLGGTYPDPTVDDGADGSAIHDDVAAEISAITEKGSPVSADLVVIEDSADSNNKKRAQVGNLPGGAPSGPAGGDLGGTYPDPTVDDGADGSAIHDDVAAEINAIAEKVSPVGADIIVIEDSAASNAKKKVQITNLPDGAPSGPAGGDLGGTYPDPTVDDGADGSAIHDDVAAEISAITEKVTPVSADLVVIEDSAASNAKKRVQVGNLPSPSDVLKADGSVDIINSVYDAAAELTIAAGVVTRTKAIHTIDTESDASSDDLLTINGGADGLIVRIRAENAARTVILKDGAGNLELGGQDIALDDTDQYIELQYDGTLSKWVLVGQPGEVIPGEPVVFEIGHGEIIDALSNDEFHRFQLQAGETFTLTRLELQQKGGGSVGTVSVNVYDSTGASQMDSVTMGSVSVSGGISVEAALILIRVSNSSGGDVNGTIIVRGYITAAPEYVALEMGHGEIPDALSNEEFHRFQLQAGEVFTLLRLELQQKGGGSVGTVSVNVYDSTGASQMDSVTMGSVSVTGGVSSTAALILIRVTNSSGADKEGTIIVHGTITS